MNHRRLYSFALCALASLAAANALLVVLLLSNGPADDKQSVDYSYRGDDFPESWPLPSTPPVALVIENPMHYSITGLDAREEWAASNPKGFGYIRLGPEHRAFAVSMFHQLHCLRLFRSALAGDHREPTEMHFGHCLVYLRQLILCDADLTLEPYDIVHRDYNVKQDQSIHVCRDWNQVYDAMSDNWETWLQYRNHAFSSYVNRTAS